MRAHPRAPAHARLAAGVLVVLVVLLVACGARQAAAGAPDAPAASSVRRDPTFLGQD